MPPTATHEQVARLRHDARVVGPSSDLPHGRGQPGDAHRGELVGGVARPELAEVAPAPDKEGAVLADRGAVGAAGRRGHHLGPCNHSCPAAARLTLFVVSGGLPLSLSEAASPTNSDSESEWRVVPAASETT